MKHKIIVLPAISCMQLVEQNAEVKEMHVRLVCGCIGIAGRAAAHQSWGLCPDCLSKFIIEVVLLCFVFVCFFYAVNASIILYSERKRAFFYFSLESQ